MKCFKQLFSFILWTGLLCGHSNYTYAETSNAAEVGHTTHAYNPNKFCDEDGAEQAMKDLEKVNAKKFEKIKIYKDEIEDLVASDKLVNTIRNLKDRYIESVSKISDIKNRPELLDFVGYLRTIKLDGEVLQGVNSESPKRPSRFFSKASVKQLQESLDSAPKELAKKTQAQINQIVDQIPASISPEQINLMMQNSSPTINKLLERDITKESIEACLSNNATEESCNQIGIAPTEKKNLIQTLTLEINALAQQLSTNPPIQNHIVFTNEDKTNLTQLVNETKVSLENSSAAINQFSIANKQSSDSVTLDDNTPSKKSFSEKARDQIATNEKQLMGPELLFYRFSINLEEELQKFLIDLDTREGEIKALEIQKNYQDQAVLDAANFKKNCNFVNKESSTITKEEVNACVVLIKKIAEKVISLNQSHIYKIAELNTKIKNLMSEDNFGDIETMKKYIAEKYMCSCNKDKKSLSVNKDRESLVLKGESCTTEFLSLTKIDGLSSVSNAIANALYAHEIKLPMDDESCTMTPERLAPTANTCKSNKFVSTNFSDLCKQIKSEYEVKAQNIQDNTQQNEKWEKFNKDNYVEYDSSSPDKYKAERKKDKWRVFGEGILPVIPNVLPIWLGNFQLKNNINMLTTQGMMQKQYLHNAGIFNQSPWMNNFNHFGYGNPFMNGTNFLPNKNSSNGFNFGQ